MSGESWEYLCAPSHGQWNWGPNMGGTLGGKIQALHTDQTWEDHWG